MLYWEQSVNQKEKNCAVSFSETYNALPTQIRPVVQSNCDNSAKQRF